jgi:hypothetical protein
MGRKRKATATRNGSVAAPQGNGKPKRGEKTAAIKELFASGVKEASAINAAMKGRGLSVSMPVIYQTIKKLKGGKGGGKKRGRRKARAAVTTTAAAGRRPSSGSVGLEVIEQLVEITQKAGGVDVVVGLLQTMKRVQ